MEEPRDVFVAELVHLVEREDHLLSAVAAEEAVAEAVEVGEEEAAAERHTSVHSLHLDSVEVDLCLPHHQQLSPVFLPQEQLKLKSESLEVQLGALLKSPIALQILTDDDLMGGRAESAEALFVDITGCVD